VTLNGVTALILHYIGTCTSSCHQSTYGTAVILEICHKTLPHTFYYYNY